jgi:hypothetical protein
MSMCIKELYTDCVLDFAIYKSAKASNKLYIFIGTKFFRFENKKIADYAVYNFKYFDFVFK